MLDQNLFFIITLASLLTISEQAEETPCEPGFYWDGALKKCYSCNIVYYLDKAFCCRNCPDYCQQQELAFVRTTRDGTKTVTEQTEHSSSERVNQMVGLYAIIALLSIFLLAILIIAFILIKRRYSEKRSQNIQNVEGSEVLLRTGSSLCGSNRGKSSITLSTSSNTASTGSSVGSSLICPDIENGTIRSNNPIDIKRNADKHGIPFQSSSTNKEHT